MSEKIKTNTLFDHLKEITQNQRPDYWEILSDASKRTFSTFMINRYLSMNYDWVEIIDQLQPYTLANQLDPKLVYKLYIDVFPKSNIFLKYIKSRSEKYTKELLELFMLHYNVSKHEANDYLDILFSKEDGIKEIKKIVAMYGNDEKEIKKMMKV